MSKEDFRLKLRYILWPYLRVLVFFMVGTALLHAAVFTALPQAEPPDWLWTFVGPLVGCGALLLLVLWPNFRLLKDKGRGSQGQLLLLVALGTMACAWGGIGHYLRAALSPLQQLPSLAAVGRYPAARYYQVRQLVLDTPNLGLETQAEVTGKNDEHFNFTLLAATPVATAPPAAPPAWIGFRYSHEISNHTTPAEKEAAYKAFITNSQAQFDRDKLRPFTYLERCPNDSKRAGLRLAASRSARYRAGAAAPLILLPVYEPFARRGHEAWAVLWWSAAIGNGLFFVALLLLPLEAEHRQRLLAGQPLDRSLGWLGDYLKPFLPRPGYVATPLLLDANILLYGSMAVTTASGLSHFSSATLLAWGASYGPAVAGGAWWRLLSSTFLHGGFLHLANNMVLLGILGWQLEAAIGSLRLLVVYVLAGIGASLVSFWWHPGIVGVGASGALFGLMGLGLTLFWRPQADVGLKAVLATVVLVTGVFSLAIGFFTPNVDNAAHLGGLAIGAVLGLVLWPWLRPALEAHAETAEE